MVNFHVWWNSGFWCFLRRKVSKLWQVRHWQKYEQWMSQLVSTIAFLITEICIIKTSPEKVPVRPAQNLIIAIVGHPWMLMLLSLKCYHAAKNSPQTWSIYKTLSKMCSKWRKYPKKLKIVYPLLYILWFMILAT